jgi:hypothetical protein
MANPFWQLKPEVPLDSLPYETSSQDVKDFFGALLQTILVEAETMRNEVGFACVFLREIPGQKTLSIGKIATFFLIEKHSIIHYYS